MHGDEREDVLYCTDTAEGTVYTVYCDCDIRTVYIPRTVDDEIICILCPHFWLSAAKTPAVSAARLFKKNYTSMINLF